MVVLSAVESQSFTLECPLRIGIGHLWSMKRFSERSIEALLADCAQQGAEVSFAQFVNQHQKMPFATAYRMCGVREGARGILQETLIVLVRRAADSLRRGARAGRSMQCNVWALAFYRQVA